MNLVSELAPLQLGWETPNDNIFNFLVLFLGGSSIAGTIVTLKQLTSGDMSMAQFQRYKNFFGLSAEDDAKKVAGEMKYGEDEQVKPSEGAAADAAMVGAVQADCIFIVYLCVPVCVTEGGGASSTLS